MKFAAIFTALMGLFLASAPPVSAQPSKSDLDELLDRYARLENFNGTVLIARDGKVITSKSYGFASEELRVPNTPSLTYRVGSVTKPFTATLAMALVEKGQLRLDGTVGEYLPELYGDTAIADVTLTQLLTHTSGIVDVPGRFEDPFYQTTARMSFTPLEFAKDWIKPELVEEPGTRWRYNNNAFLLIGAIISEATGKSYAENLEEHVFTPAGMTSSGVANKDDLIAGLATGYARDENENPVKPLYMDPSVFYAAAGIYSTAQDMFRFDQALYSDAILSEAQRKLMHSPQVRFYAYGWGIGNYRLPDGTTPDGSTLRVMEHTGSVPGYQSYYLRSERNRDFVFVVSNFWQGQLVTRMGQDIMQVLNGKPPKKVADVLLPALQSGGLADMIAAYETLTTNSDGYDLSETALNSLGYRLLADDELSAAITVFEWNVASYPASANTHDSLGEAYRKAKRGGDALASYRRALELNPENENAAKTIAELEAELR